MTYLKKNRSYTSTGLTFQKCHQHEVINLRSSTCHQHRYDHPIRVTLTMTRCFLQHLPRIYRSPPSFGPSCLQKLYFAITVSTQNNSKNKKKDLKVDHINPNRSNSRLETQFNILIICPKMTPKMTSRTQMTVPGNTYKGKGHFSFWIRPFW